MVDSAVVGILELLRGFIVFAVPATVAFHFLLRRRKKTVRRAAFDIGSGASKVLVADVDPKTGALVGKPLFQAEKPCAFKADAQAQADGSLSNDIKAKGLDIIGSLAAKACAVGATEACGIATEVFRTAPNGMDFLKEVEEATGVPMVILSQADEARLGLATAEALMGASSGHSRSNKYDAAWDSGGGSFQISTRSAETADGRPIGKAKMRTYVGKLGTSPAYERLITRVRKQKFDASVELARQTNPVIAKEAEALVLVLKTELPSPPPEWLIGAEVVAIGAFNSIFAVTLRARRLLVIGGAAAEATITTPGKEGTSADGSFTLEEAKEALSAVSGLSDNALMDVSGHGEDAEGPHLVAPKISLLVAVASHLKISRVHYRRATGGCAGLMGLGSFVPVSAPAGFVPVLS